jgi:hypothetical protein
MANAQMLFVKKSQAASQKGRVIKKMGMRIFWRQERIICIIRFTKKGR